jgi:hypothetical protein
MAYSNDGWGPDNIDRVFAHETGHVFGCPDEYAGSSCNCGGSWGRFGRPNTNCENCAPGGGIDCLMKGNTWQVCDATHAHLGWFKQFPKVRGVPALVRSRFGTRGNFELLTPSETAGLDFTWRNNDDVPALPWAPPFHFADGLGAVEAVTMIQSSFGSPGNLEVIARVGTQLVFFWRDSGPAFRWNGPFPVAAGAAGNPVLIQSRFGTRGNFELVFPSTSGGLMHMWRNNDPPNLPWSAPAPFGGALGQVEAVTMIQSNYGSPGNLELIARAGNQLFFFWRGSAPPFTWNGPFPLNTGVRGNPVLIQSRFGTRGNFELVAPAEVGGGLLHLWRNNDVPGIPWSAATRFGQNLGRVDAVAMIQGNFGSPGNLEVIARAGDRLFLMWRDSGPAFHWNGPWALSTVPAGTPSLSPVASVAAA